MVGPTKTRRARTLDLPSPCVAALELHRARHAGESPWIFCHPAGGPLAGEPYGGSTFTTRFERLLARPELAELPRIVLYSLRHPCATALLAMDVPIADVAYMLRHKDAATTMKAYARWLKSHRRLAAEKMAAQNPWTGGPGTESDTSATRSATPTPTARAKNAS